MASSLAKPVSHHRQSNSASSSSIITVQRAASLSPRSSTRPNASTLRSQSPNESRLAPTNLSVRTLSPDARRRSSAICSRPDSGHGVREGIGNLNRWSQSTASSKSSASHNRRGSFSKRISGTFSSFGGFASPQMSPNVLTKPRPVIKEGASDIPGPSGQSSPVHSPPKLPFLVTTLAPSYGAGVSHTPSTAATITPTNTDLLSTSTSTSGEPDYFGEKWTVVPTSKHRPGKTQSIAVSSFATKPFSQTYVAQSSSSESSWRPIPVDSVSSLYSSTRSSLRPNNSERYHFSHHRPSRNRGDPHKTSAGTEGESSASSVQSSRARIPRRKTPSQKAMLSKALQKANHAVLLDNAQNFEGAMDAYADACILLQQVMSRSSTDEDRRKLEAVRTTYTNRINELRNTDLLYQGADGKALPEPPRERDSQDQDAMSPVTEDDNEHNIMKPSIAPDMIDDRQSRREYRDPSFVSDMSVPPRRQSLVPPIYNVQDKILHASEMAQSLTPPIFQVEDRILQASETARYQQHYGQSQMRANSYMPNASIEPPVELEAPTYSYYVPPPSSRRPLSPAFRAELSASPPDKYVEPLEPSQESSQPNHVRQDTAESTSWLDTIDESGGSSSESVHSRTSSIGLRRKRIRATSGATEAEFDAALDAAVEAAYDDGFEPDDDEDDDDRPVRSHRHMSGEFEVVSNARRNVEMAREKVREAEKEAAILYAKNWEKPPLQESFEKRDSIELEYEDDDAEEEERMMEEIARYYNIDDSEYDAQSKSALPRQSDSSGFSGRTWGSSIGSLPTTAATSSSITEASRLPSMISQLKIQTLPPPAHPPPLGALPPPPSTLMSAAPFQLSPETVSKPSNSSIRLTQGVRERRFLGTNFPKLKIETHSGTGSNADSGGLQKPLSTLDFPAVLSRLTMEPPKSALALPESQGISSSRAVNPSIVSSQATNLLESLPLSAPTSGDEVVTSASTTNVLTKVTSAESEKGAQSIPNSPSRFTSKGLGLRKNFSSSSLKNKGLAAPAHNTLDFPPASSASTQRKAPVTAVPFMPPSMGSNLIVGRLPADGIYLFESDIHSPITPGSPNPSAANGPLPLEPCPEINHLRPFWLLRCIYQTISHPRGAYISTKLFIPNSIWKVKNVKLKSVEEKVSTCDLLSAALLKLARVDTLDAGAVLKEMLSFEEVTSLAQTNLSKKLGNEVGPTGHSTIFKGSTTTDETASYSETLTTKSTNVNSKYSLSSWRKKRSKSSTVPTANPGLAKNTSKNGSLEHLTIDSVPMTDLLDPKLPRRDLGRIQYTGPNSNYMAALARLCDAAQVLDQIGRQVEDPGLKRSSEEYVGLELAVNSAAQFFGNYVCRFVMSDVGMMLDKFIKRGTEWVLA